MHATAAIGCTLRIIVVINSAAATTTGITANAAAANARSSSAADNGNIALRVVLLARKRYVRGPQRRMGSVLEDEMRRDICTGDVFDRRSRNRLHMKVIKPEIATVSTA